jgi:DNA-binding NtrC family response regulator
LRTGTVETLLREISDAEGFASGAPSLLRVVQREAQLFMHEGDRAGDLRWRRARVIATSVWFRQDAKVRGCRMAKDVPDDSPHMSTSLWAKADHAKGAVAVLLHDGSWVVPSCGDTPQGTSSMIEPGLSERTQAMYEADAATHVLALPTGSERELTGLVTVELMLGACRTAHPPFWLELVKRLQPLAEAPAALLATLPTEEAADIKIPEWAGRAMREVFHAIHGASLLEQSVMLSGPSGTGKSKIARELHERSRRKSGPFITVQTSTIPPTLFSSEMFGALAGAASGITRELPGLVHTAEGGTLFLDDVHKTPLDSQAALLELLETRSWRKLGSDKTQKSDIRFIAATSVDLEAEVRAGRFLPDLMYRLQIMVIDVPSMDRRRDEFAWWARRFAEDVHRGAGLPGEVSLAEDFLPALRQRPLPGNLRSLQSLVTSAYAKAATRSLPTGPALRAAHLPALTIPRHVDLIDKLEQAADAFIQEAKHRYDQGRSRLVYETDASVFKSIVLARAAAQMAPTDVIRVLGTDAQLANRNASKTLHAAEEAWASLRRRLQDED